MYQVIDQIMDWIMLTKIRNYVWRAKIRSAWHNRVKALLEVFFGPKPLWLDHRSKKRGLKNKTRKLFTKEKSFKKEVGGVKKLTCVQWKFGMLHNKPKESLHDKMECRPIFCPKTPCSHFCCVQKKKLPVGPALHYVTQTLFWVVVQNFLSQLTWSNPSLDQWSDL